MKKKSLSYLLSMVLLMVLFTGMAMPASAASATLSVANVQAKPGDTVIVDVSLNGATSGLQLTLGYDSAVLAPMKIEAGPQCPSGWMVVTSNNPEMGRFVAAPGSPKNETINGVVARYTYEVKANADLGKSDLQMVTYILSDAGNDFNATVLSHGSVTVVSSDPNPTDPAPTDPAPTDPTPTDPTPTNPNPTDPTPTNPTPTNPTPTNPTPTNPAPTNPAPTNPGNKPTGTPKTGDANIWMFVILFALSAMAIVVSRVVMTKKQKS